MKREDIQKSLQKELKKDRYTHTQGVMYTAAAMAMCYGHDPEPALMAGLLHDCGKRGNVDDQIKLCKKLGVKLTETELAIPSLIHAKLGACLAEHEYGVTDLDILNAILYHTTGRPDMSELEKILYLADYIEPNRKMLPNLPALREESFKDLDHAVCLCAEATLSYLKENGKKVDDMTIKTYEFYHE